MIKIYFSNNILLNKTFCLLFHFRKCNFCGLLSTISSEASVFILTVITIDRYISVIYPFSLKRRTKTFAILCMTSVWTLAVILAVLPLLDYNVFGQEFYESNGVCLALQIHDPYGKGWEYSAFIFCILNSAAFMFITYAYISMSLTITSSTIGLRTTQQQQDRNIAKRCGFIVATDFLCWMPIVIIKILVLSGIKIQNTKYKIQNIKYKIQNTKQLYHFAHLFTFLFFSSYCLF